MAKNAEDRYQSAWGIKADLEICADKLEEIGQIDSIQLALQDVCDQFQIPQKLYGRDKEVAMLLAAFDRVASLQNNSETTSAREQTGNPRFQVEMMLVSGYAGIGKSALVQEIYKPITQKRGYFISGKFDQFQRNIPYSAIADALQKLVQQLGIGFPEKPSQSDIRLELKAIASLIGSKPIEDLSHLPQMTEPDKLAAMRILSSITVAAYIVAPDLMPLLASKQVNLSIQYGNAFASPFAYALCGLILCGMVGNIESGYQFGQLALRQLSQPNTHSFRARTLMFVNIFIIHRKEHVRKILQPLLEAYQSGLETGDFEFAAYCAHTYCLQSFVVGK